MPETEEAVEAHWPPLTPEHGFPSQHITQTLAGMFCALAVVGSVFSFPVFGSKCAPVQHMVNILCAVLLGPYYGVGVAFESSVS